MQRPSVVSILAMAVRTEAAVGLCRLRPVPLAVVARVARMRIGRRRLLAYLWHLWRLDPAPRRVFCSCRSALEAVASLPRCLYVGFSACQLAVANIQALSHTRLAQAAVSRASVGQTKRRMDRQQAELAVVLLMANSDLLRQELSIPVAWVWRPWRAGRAGR
ncbi:hypothetical protein BC831DRAFT_484113 [Entophlyctis helioformis]|nr:hypothetical protein BC831DRAFT_484113 [Entophlyctis helioformis]